MAITMKESGIRRVAYQCQSCGETDFYKVFQEEPYPASINCWNCKNGYKGQGPGMVITGFVE